MCRGILRKLKNKGDIGMVDDRKLNCWKLPKDLEEVKIYPLGDVHVGSENFDIKIWNRWKKEILENENHYVIIVGDLFDNGLKNSKTNSYEASMRPREQKEWWIRELEPIKDRILGVVTGNHEYRSVKESDDCPLYDVCCALGIEKLYRESMCFFKISLGSRNGGKRQHTYVGMLTHGGSQNKTKQFSYVVDGIDFMVSGHTHQPESTFPLKLVVDSKNDVILDRTVYKIVVPSFQRFGGYAMRGLYLPTSSDIFPVMTLSGKTKKIEVSWR